MYYIIVLCYNVTLLLQKYKRKVYFNFVVVFLYF